MTDRIEAAAEALFIHRDADVFYADIWKNYGCECGWSSELDDADSLREHQAEAVMAALDAYAEGRDLGLMILRERIAREIEAMADEYRTHDEIDSMQGEVKDQLHAAVRIARGTDPGKDTR